MTNTESLFQKHQVLLDQACKAVQERGHWLPYPEIPSEKIYGEGSRDAGLAAYEATLNSSFTLKGPSIAVAQVGCEISPFTGALNISYPSFKADDLIAKAAELLPNWRDAGCEVRTGICMEILHRLNQRSFEIGNATMHTTGQGFAMAFQAGGPHAQDRGLEAIANAWLLTRNVPRGSVWNKPQGKRDPFIMSKKYTVAPKGVALVVACSTFPTWNTYPGLFASLVTGNPVIIKPHNQAVLPVAITVEVCQEVLAEAGFDPCLVQMAAEGEEVGIAQELATHSKVKLIDYTGGNAFGDWLTEHARQAQIYKEQAGVNTILLESAANIDAVVQNLAFALSLYSGQMCTTPQAVLIPKQGIDTSEGHLSFEQVTEKLTSAIQSLLADPERAVGVLGSIPNPVTVARLESAEALGEVLLASETHPVPGFENAVYRTPLVLGVKGSDQQWREEQFGPISFMVAVDSAEQGLQLIEEAVSEKGAITFATYSTKETVLERAEEVALNAGVALSCNLDSGVFVNQAAAFSDFHATGMNPAANASLTDAAFVAGRFAVVQSRKHVVND